MFTEKRTWLIRPVSDRQVPAGDPVVCRRGPVCGRPDRIHCFARTVTFLVV